MDITLDSFLSDYLALRNKNPLVLNFTNHVAMDLNANMLLAIGASPIMSFEKSEISELAKYSSSIVVNIGTLNENFLDLCDLVLEEALKNNKPVVLDPVGSGATKIRTDTAKKYAMHPATTIIRGNASEIAATFSIDTQTQTKGVDSSISSEHMLDDASSKLPKLHKTVIMSGKIDAIFSQGKKTCLDHGHPFMQQVTAMGCSATAIVAAFLAINENPRIASAHGMLAMGLAGEIAAKQSYGPGSFRMNFLDAIANLESHIPKFGISSVKVTS